MFLSCVWLGHGGKWTLVWPGAFAMIPVSATGLYILAGVSNKWWAFLENNAVVQSLGNWSYSIYLWHWPVVIAINFLWLNTIPFKLKLAGFITSIFLGFLSFKFVESAFREKKQSSRQILIKILLMYFVAVVILFGMINKQYSPIAKAAISKEQQVTQNKLPKKFENHKLQPADNLNVYSINTHKNKKVIVIGDSHAEHLLPWFKHYGSDYSITFAVTNGCAPLPQMNRRDNTSWYCHRSFERIQNLVAKNDFDLIVISGNWYPVDNEPPGVCHVSFAACNALNKNENQKIAVELFSQFINYNTGRNIPILIVRPTPFSNLSVSTVLPRYNLWGIEFPETFIDRNFSSKSGDLFIDQVLRSISHPALIHVVDIRSEFCRNGICNYFDADDTPVFWDDNHFNPAWLIKHGSVLFEVNSILNKE